MIGGWVLGLMRAGMAVTAVWWGARLLRRRAPPRGYVGRTYAVTGARGAYGAAMCRALSARGATVRPLSHDVDWSLDHPARSDAALAEADVLVLAHGAKSGPEAMRANADAFVVLIERFRRLHDGPVEVWAVGSEIELHPAFGAHDYYASKRAFARVARSYVRDPGLVYRHVVPASFRSGMGGGLISADTAVAITLWFVDRGARYIPVTYTGFALLNAVKFALRWRAESPETFLVRRGCADAVQVSPPS